MLGWDKDDKIKWYQKLIIYPLIFIEELWSILLGIVNQIYYRFKKK